MPTYFYSAKTADGKNETGTVSASDSRELAQDLKNKGLILIRAVVENEKKPNFLAKFSLSPKATTKDKLMITRNLQVMIATGLPLVKAFSLLASQAKGKAMKNALLDIQQQIGKGETLSNALAKYPDIFSEIFTNMISIGETSGTMEDVLSILSLQIQKEHLLKSKIRKAMIYPAILLSAMVILGIVVITVFVPGIKTLFTGLGVALPFYTKIIIGAGDLFAQYWYLVLLFFILAVPFFLSLLKTKSGKKALDTVLIKIPVFSNLVKKSNSASLIRSLSSLISSGVPLVQALDITSRTVPNVYFQSALKEAEEKIKKGDGLYDSLKSHRALFPFGALETIQVGEETGETGAILKRLAEFYEEEVADAMDNLSLLIEPVLIIILGGAVGIFAIAVLGPLYSVLGSIK